MLCVHECVLGLFSVNPSVQYQTFRELLVNFSLRLEINLNKTAGANGRAIRLRLCGYFQVKIILKNILLLARPISLNYTQSRSNYRI